MAYRLILQSRSGAKGMKRQFRAARDAGLIAAAEYWAEHILVRHFDMDASSRYRYPNRTEAHLKRKRREGRGENPNVYAGRLRVKMMGMKPRITVNARGVTLVWRGLPKYTYVVDTVEWKTRDKRWDDEYLKYLESSGQSARAQGIRKWRLEHPEAKDGRFVVVKRPNKPAELTAMNREDADLVGATFRRVFVEKLKEAGHEPV